LKEGYLKDILFEKEKLKIGVGKEVIIKKVNRPISLVKEGFPRNKVLKN